jgi:CubicO group peptidase (beta-lactamase class C family)
MRDIAIVLCAAVFAAACSGTHNSSAAVSSYVYQAPPALDDGWPTGDLAQVGLDRARIEAMTNAIRTHPEFNIHAFLIERSGRLVYEEYFSGPDEQWGRQIGQVTFTRDTLHDLRSVTKSVVSALIGIAYSAGAVATLDAPLLDYFPEDGELQVADRRRITIRHALMMSAGFDWNENVPYNDPGNDEIVMNRSADPIGYVLSRRIVAAPGTTWRYNGGTTQVLGAIVQRAVKQPLQDYAASVLFSPLGIARFEWLGRVGGLPSAASGLRLRPRDLAKFGSLYLHEGRWHDRQVIPPEWVAESTRRHISFPGNTTRGYGYLWWHTCYSTWSNTYEVPTAVGNGLQRIFLLRGQQTAVTVLSGRYNQFKENPPERMLLDYVIPALPKTAPSKCPT